MDGCECLPSLCQCNWHWDVSYHTWYCKLVSYMSDLIINLLSCLRQVIDKSPEFKNKESVHCVVVRSDWLNSIDKASSDLETESQLNITGKTDTQHLMTIFDKQITPSVSVDLMVNAEQMCLPQYEQLHVVSDTF